MFVAEWLRHYRNAQALSLSLEYLLSLESANNTPGFQRKYCRYRLATKPTTAKPIASTWQPWALPSVLYPRVPRPGRPRQSWRERPKIERKFGECKQFHGLRRARYWGLGDRPNSHGCPGGEPQTLGYPLEATKSGILLAVCRFVQKEQLLKSKKAALRALKARICT